MRLYCLMSLNKILCCGYEIGYYFANMHEPVFTPVVSSNYDDMTKIQSELSISFFQDVDKENFNSAYIAEFVKV